MNNKTKTALYWLIIAIGYLVHNLLELSGLMFGKDIRVEGANGAMPLAAHIFLTVVVTGTMLISTLTIAVSAKGFRWFSFVWSLLLLLLNAAHLIETIIKETGDISQIGLLLLIQAVNILLVITIRKWTRESATGKYL